jgi:hypothetical protein
MDKFYEKFSCGARETPPEQAPPMPVPGRHDPPPARDSSPLDDDINPVRGRNAPLIPVR